MNLRSSLRILLVAVFLCAITRHSPADEAFTEATVQFEGGLSYGVYLGEHVNEIPTPYGVGAHAKAGYTFELPLYVGGEFTHFFGARQPIPGHQDVEGALSITHFGAEAGYDFGLGSSVVARPKVGLGAATVVAEETVEGITGQISETGLAMTAGLQGILGLKPWLVTAEVRYTSLSIDTESLRQIPNLDVEDDVQLDGLLMGIGVGVAF
jgi:hypothetical protein